MGESQLVYVGNITGQDRILFKITLSDHSKTCYLHLYTRYWVGSGLKWVPGRKERRVIGTITMTQDGIGTYIGTMQPCARLID